MPTETLKNERKTLPGVDAQTHSGAVNGLRSLSAWLSRLKQTKTSDYTYYYQSAFRLLLVPVLFSLPFLVFSEKMGGALRYGVLTWLILMLVFMPVYIANIVYFIPKFFTVGRYRSYLLLLLVSCTITIWLGNVSIHVLALKSALIMEPDRPFGPLTFMSLALSTIFEIMLHSEDFRRKSEQIEKEKIRLELSFLKAQINPHFLFNTLNNIHSMAELKSDKTSDAIMMLSDLLRYVLYGTNHGCVPLQKEIESIENYIAIQRLRLPKRESIVIRFETTGHYHDSVIEPQLLLPFVENAFKHGISYQQQSTVLIQLHVENNGLQFRVHNTKLPDLSHLTEAGEDESGIGLANIRRRLELLYPGNHELQIRNEKDVFDIYLTVHL